MLTSHTLPTLAEFVRIDYVCLRISKEWPNSHPGEVRNAVVMGTLMLHRTLWGKKKAEPVGRQVRFAWPKEKLCFFISLSLSPLVLFSLLSHVYPLGHCCHGNTAGRVYRMWPELFFSSRSEQEVGTEAVLWLRADIRSFEASTWAESSSEPSGRSSNRTKCSFSSLEQPSSKLIGSLKGNRKQLFLTI